MTSKMLRSKASELMTTLREAQSRREHYIEELEKDKEELAKKEKEKTTIEEAQKALLCFLEQGKQKSKEIIEEIGTVALVDVFGEGYGLGIEYSEKYNTSAASIRISIPTGDDGEQITTSPNNRGGGLNDIVTMSFKLCQLNLVSPEPQGPLMADEAFKNLDKTRRPDCASVFRSVMNPDGAGAEGQGRQFIFTTHAEEFIVPDSDGQLFADRVFRVILNHSENRAVVEDVTDDFREEKSDE